jgi:transposase
MDKGFASISNVDTMLKGNLKSNFILALPFTMAFAKKIPNEYVKRIERPENIINFTKNTWGVCTERPWEKEFSVFTHIYYNWLTAENAKYNIHNEVKKVIDLANENILESNFQKDFKKWLDIKDKNKANPIFSVKNDIIEKRIANSGWLVLISNMISDPTEALKIYRAKDVAEKAFFRLKSDLDMRRLRVHSDTSAQAKLFVSFISLIILSYIDKKMVDANLYKSFTLKELIIELEKLKIIDINNNRILEPLTANHKKILDAFQLIYPNVMELND